MTHSTFQQQCYVIIASIPEGYVATYGQVARLCGYPNHARHVGALLKQLPADSRLPWHRVINSQRRLAFPGGSDAYARQKRRLEREGVVFQHEKVALSSFQWLTN